MTIRATACLDFGGGARETAVHADAISEPSITHSFGSSVICYKKTYARDRMTTKEERVPTQTTGWVTFFFVYEAPLVAVAAVIIAAAAIGS